MEEINNGKKNYLMIVVITILLLVIITIGVYVHDKRLQKKYIEVGESKISYDDYYKAKELYKGQPYFYVCDIEGKHCYQFTNIEKLKESLKEK